MRVTAPVRVRTSDATRPPARRDEAPVVATDPIRWNRTLSKAFDVTRETFPARSAEQALVAKYLEVEIKALERRAARIPAVRMGAYLTALKDVLQNWTVDDVRNLNARGEETPPTYDVIQLNSTTRADFLIDGMRFLRALDGTDQRASVRVEPWWYGLDLTVYGMRSTGAAEQLLGAISTRAAAINFLKGEAFALSGEFLPKTDETFSDLFLEATNAAALDRVVALVNSKGAALENRGVLLMGPPGTGKTLAARVVRNQAQATFIWVSARDFAYSGSFGGFSQAFDLAKECAPSIIVYEDVDNWIDSYTVDFLKTEMDGVARTKGIVTMMTTNEPERLPSALIDRPGRFHDVLKFDLPDEPARAAMLTKWLPELAAPDRQRAVKATAGYSGAHVRELARFATIIAEQEHQPIDQALTTALAKLAAQRELITATQRTGSRYRMAPALTEKQAAPGVHRAHAWLRIKSLDQAQRSLTGMATTPEPDRVGDIIEPLGVTFTNPSPLLLYHDSKKPVGQTRFSPPTTDGLPFAAQLSTVASPGTVRDRIDEAWDSLSADPPLITGVSIGFRELEPPTLIKATGGLRYGKIEILELSLVVIPANAQAVIQTIKSLDIGLAASGKEADGGTRHTSGASDTTRVVKARMDRHMKKTYTEQISAFEATRQAKSAEIDAIIDKSSDEGVTLDAEQKTKHDELVSEVKEIDEHLVRLRAAEDRNKQAAKPIHGDDPESASRSRAGQVITVEKKLPPGIEFARYAMCIASAKSGGPAAALEIAKARYPDEARLQIVLKAAVAAGTTLDATWAGSLVQYQDFVGDFIDYLRPMSIVGKFGQNGVPALNRVPFNIRVAGQTTGGSGYWVGEGKPKPLTKFGFTTVTLRWAKVANIAVLTQEEARFSSPSAEAKVRDALAAAIVERMDIDFIDPAKAEVTNVSPASITNGVAAIPPTGTDADHFRADFKALMAPIIAANINPAGLVLIMSTSMALSLSLMMNTLGQREFPDVTMRGGSIIGIPVITSEYLTALGSPSTQMIVLVNAPDVYLADDGQVVIDASDQASLEMSDAPTQDGTTGTGASLVSLWQSNLLGLRAERYVNWKLRRAAAAQYLSPAAYA